LVQETIHQGPLAAPDVRSPVPGCNRIKVTRLATHEKPSFRKEIKFSLRTKIIWLIVILIVLILAVVYRTILQDEKTALTNLMTTSGGALTTLLADNTRVVLNNALLEKARSGNITEETYEQLDYFALGIAETLDKMVDQKDVVYTAILNKFGKIVGHSKSDHEIKENTVWKPLGALQTYKNMYNPGEPISPVVQEFKGDFYNPKLKKTVNGELFDISFPMVVDSKATSLNAYEGEVHIGISKESIYKTIRGAEAKLQGVSVVSFIVGLLGAIFLAALIISPIMKLVMAMGRVANGDLKQKVIVNTRDEVEVLAHSFNKMTEGLSKYVSAGLVQKLMKHPDALSLGGSYKRITMFFSDIRNFTGTSEKMKPDEVVAYLNEYLDIMTKIVLKNGGDIDKYVGDEIMALYGVFDADEANLQKHSMNAIRTAVEMNHAMIQFNEKRASKGLNQIKMGIGINTSDVILGNMGSTERMDYTVIGDGVNLAARLCDNAGKDYKEENGNIVHLRNILFTETTYELIRDIVVVDEKTINIKVKGKEKPIKIYQAYDIKA
jgi:class 3 adenylate cyclase